MPGPFPGMDPYLEHPARWPGVHDGMIVAMRAELNRILLPKYVAVIGERCRVIAEERNIYPDVFVRLREPSDKSFAGQRGVATAIAPDPPVIIETEGEEHIQTFLEIRDTATMQRVVTEIEILSLANKAYGGRDRESYLQKQRELLHSQTHLLEIDILRAGAPSVASCSDSLYTPPDWDYIVCLHRAGTGIRFETWPVKLEQRLPRFSVPLETGTPDVTLDIQAVFNRNYDEGAYAYQIDYRQSPVPPLTEEQEQWANGILSEQNLR